MEIKPGKDPYTPRKVNQERIDQILYWIKQGSPIKYAAESNGITKTHFYNLVKQGLCDMDHDIHDSIHARLVNSLRSIERDDVISCLYDIRHNDKGHKGAEWILEHKYWREFGGNAQIKELSDDIEKLKQGKLEVENDQV
jgi:hypothetical protein